MGLTFWKVRAGKMLWRKKSGTHIKYIFLYYPFFLTNLLLNIIYNNKTHVGQIDVNWLGVVVWRDLLRNKKNTWVTRTPLPGVQMLSLSAQLCLTQPLPVVCISHQSSERWFGFARAWPEMVFSVFFCNLKKKIVWTVGIKPEFWVSSNNVFFIAWDVMPVNTY